LFFVKVINSYRYFSVTIILIVFPIILFGQNRDYNREHDYIENAAEKIKQFCTILNTICKEENEYLEREEAFSSLLSGQLFKDTNVFIDESIIEHKSRNPITVKKYVKFIAATFEYANFKFDSIIIDSTFYLKEDENCLILTASFNRIISKYYCSPEIAIIERKRKYAEINIYNYTSRILDYSNLRIARIEDEKPQIKLSKIHIAHNIDSYSISRIWTDFDLDTTQVLKYIDKILDSNLENANLFPVSAITDTGTVFKIDLYPTSEKQLSKSQVTLPQVISIEENKTFHYLAGTFRNYQDAKDYLGEIKDLGISTAKIVSFKDGKEITLKEAGDDSYSISHEAILTDFEIDTSAAFKYIDKIFDENIYSETKIMNLLFSNDSDSINPIFYENLDSLAFYLQNNHDAVIEILGYTDLQGDEDYNMQLSIRRASFVRDYLIEKGANNESLKIKGFGESNQIATDLRPESKKYNSRVEFKVINSGKKGKLVIIPITVPEQYRIK